MRITFVMYTAIIILGVNANSHDSLAKTQEECELEFKMSNSYIQRNMDVVLREVDKLKRRLSETSSTRLDTSEYCNAVFSWKSSATSGLRWTSGPCKNVMPSAIILEKVRLDKKAVGLANDRISLYKCRD